jgi:hypothetical protein
VVVFHLFFYQKKILVGLGWVLGGFSGSAPAGAFLVDTRLPMVQSTCILLLHVVLVNDYQGTLTKTIT